MFRSGRIKKSRNLKSLESGIASHQRRLVIQRASLTVATAIILSTLLSLRFTHGPINLHPGDVSPHEIRAGRSVFYVDTTRTKRLQDAARASVLPVYDSDDQAPARADRTANRLFDSMETERQNLRSTGSIHLQQELASSQFNSLLPRPALRRMLTIPSPVFQNLRRATVKVLDSTMEREIRDNGSDLKLAREEAIDALNTALPSLSDRAVGQLALDQALRSNHHLDQRRTELAREAAIRTVRPYVGRVLMGDRILSPGEVVTQQAFDKLKALGLVDPNQELATTVAICLLCAMMVLLVAYYISRNLPDLYGDVRRLSLLVAMVGLGILALKVGSNLFGLEISGGQPGYLGLAGITATGMLIAALLDPHLALLIVALLSVQSGILMNHEVRFTVMTLLSSLVGIAGVQGTRRQSQSRLPALVAALGLADIGMAWLLGLLFADTPKEMLQSSFWALGAAFLAVFLYWMGALLLERPFGLLTTARLMELSASDNPLLRRLCAAAPGTYAHSMLVGNLGEAAGRAIGADAHLCRIGGYYHDIGKINQPDFFVENQTKENVHGRLSPSLSALIIIAHVREGIAMGRAAKLPKEICDIIAQHHGTTLISYFYHRALADNGIGEGPAPPGLEERFRYPGPKPLTREAAIILLADSVEATVRSRERLTPESLYHVINEIIREKIEDRQLDESPLTFRDVRLISEAFHQVLQGNIHRRIDYRDALKEPKSDTLTFKPSLPPFAMVETKILLPEEENTHNAHLGTDILPGGEIKAIYERYDPNGVPEEAITSTNETGSTPPSSKRRSRSRRGEHTARR